MLSVSRALIKLPVPVVFFFFFIYCLMLYVCMCVFVCLFVIKKAPSVLTQIAPNSHKKIDDCTGQAINFI